VHKLGRLPIEYIPHFARVNIYSFCRKHMGKKWNFTEPELTFAKLCKELMISQSLMCNVKMSLMLFSILGID
jgi:hypothetical protein